MKPIRRIEIICFVSKIQHECETTVTCRLSTHSKVNTAGCKRTFKPKTLCSRCFFYRKNQKKDK